MQKPARSKDANTHLLRACFRVFRNRRIEFNLQVVLYEARQTKV